MGINPDPGGTESPQQSQPKEVHSKTHANENGKQTNKNPVIKNVKSSKRKQLHTKEAP